MLLNIPNTTPRFPHKFYVMLGYFTSQALLIFDFFHVPTLKTGINSWLRKVVLSELSTTYLMSEGLLKRFNEVNLSSATQAEKKRIFETTEAMLKKYMELHSLVRSTRFINQMEIAEICDETLSNFYSVSFKANDLYFTSLQQEHPPHDIYLINYAATVSLKSLPTT